MKKPHWLGTPPEFEEKKVSEELEADVIICGAGIAGVAAARSAAECGAECILFEKSAHPQSRSGQFAVIGGELLKKQWNVDNSGLANEIVCCLMRESKYWPKQRILSYFASRIGTDFDWYMEGLPKENVFFAEKPSDRPPEGTKLHIVLMHQRLREGYDPSKEPFPVYPYTVQMFPSHTAVLQNNYELAEKTGNLKTYFKTQVKKLIRDEKSGRVTGVYACSHDGKLIRATARKGVVLATGDYSGNPEMLEYYCARFANNFIIPCGVDPDGKPCNTGDGHRMGMWIGAKMEVSPHCANVHNMGSAMGVTPYLMLDLSGQRFMNEECSGQSVENQITLLKNKTAWQFFDGGWREQVPFMPVGHGACTKVLEEKDFADGKCFDKLTPMDGFASQRYIDKTIEKGDTFKADTLEELIERIGLPKEQALSSIQRYNELAKKGNDEDFGKSAARMFALEKPPFYATRITPAALLCCHSGLESDEYAHCYDEDLNLIKGLYVAGNVQGNRFAVDYPTLLPGISHSIALVFGRAAGYNAANEI